MKYFISVAVFFLNVAPVVAGDNRSVSIIAEVPSQSFYVVEQSGSTIFSGNQRMHYDTGVSNFSEVGGEIIIGASAGTISAMLLGAQALTGHYSANQIPLEVHIDSLLLTASSQQIANEMEAAASKVVKLTINAKTSDSVVADYYSASLNILFENSADL